MNINDYKYKIETHAHTSPASGCADLTPKEVIERYAKVGFSAIAITNHFYNAKFEGFTKDQVISNYLKDYYDTKNAALKYGIGVILGMEIRFPENCNDYLVFGFSEDEMGHLFDLTAVDYVSFYKEFKNDKNIIIQAHPFRNGITAQNPEYLDGVETFNMHPNHNSRIAVATQFAKAHPHLVTTCGTDFHHENHQGMGGILAKTLPQDSFQLAVLLKTRDYLFNAAGSIVIP